MIEDKVKQYLEEYQDDINSKVNSFTSIVNILHEKYSYLENCVSDMNTIKHKLNLIENKYEEKVKNIEILINENKCMKNTISFYQEIITFMMRHIKNGNENDY